MTEAVLDASVVLKWFVPGEERGTRQARALREAYRAGRLMIVVPSLLFLELLNVASRRWGWEEAALLDLAVDLEDLLFEVAEPGLVGVASWSARGLTACDAAYVTVAEERGVELITDDDLVLGAAGPIARPLVGQ